MKIYTISRGYQYVENADFEAENEKEALELAKDNPENFERVEMSSNDEWFYQIEEIK